MNRYTSARHIGLLIKFYDKQLSKVQKNAKKILQDPLLGSLEHIQSQLSELKERHRRYIFAVLSKKYGEFNARNLAQNEEINKMVDNFEDLDKRVLKIIDNQSKKLKSNTPTSKLKYSYYYKHTEAKEIKEAILETLKDHLPDLVHFPKKISKHKSVA